MPRLIIANCTKQHHDFVYRIPENGQVRRQQIPMGAQMFVHDEAPPRILKGIIAQHEKYGLIPASSIDQTRGFVGLCFAIDKPIDVDRIMQANEQNSSTLNDQAGELRKQLALSINDQLQDSDVGVLGMDMEVREYIKPGETKTDAFAEGVAVKDPRNEARSQRGRRGR